ncbi:TetR family transcriptional regulator [Mucinivorans hirudinis]|uniref:TetR family transcriptional regulator n=1 Tax=Mucinivorans hirudinis TaxID=1433126 RepID=A0A060R7L4_9BACT|nr:TetR family transcriptional regulator [Mucinivorans hirudinis]
MTKREEYLEQMLLLMEQYGVRGLTMEQIAQKLGITKRTLYNYFSDKQAMVTAIMDYFVEQRLLDIKQFISSKELNAITIQTTLMTCPELQHKKMSPILIRSIFENFPELFTKYDNLRRETVREFFVHNVEQGIEEGLYHRDFDPNIISQYIFRTFDSFWVDIMDKQEDKELLNNAFCQIFCCILRGLVTPQGSGILEPEIKRIFNK